MINGQNGTLKEVLSISVITILRDATIQNFFVLLMEIGL